MEQIGAVMVVGGGIAGMQAALDTAGAGFKVYLVEQQPAIGGVMAQLDKTFPTNDCSMCILAPKLAEVGHHPNIEILAPARLVGLAGEPGRFTARVARPARYIDPDKCITCGICAEKCPKKVSDQFNAGLSLRKAAYLLYPQAVPQKYAIDREHCIYFQKKGSCRACEKFCPTQAVNLDQADEERELEVGAVILALGFRPFDARLKPEYGYGRYPNVVTALEFERLLSATGPCLGEVKRPSDGEAPQKVAWIQCVGSRDASLGREYCSAVCCMYATKQAIIAREHDPRLEPSIFYIDLRAQGKGFDRYCDRAKEHQGVRFVRSMISRVVQDPRSHNLELTYVDEDNRIQTEEFHLVVLSVGFSPNPATAALAAECGIDLNTWGFAENPPFQLVATSRLGIFTCGTCQSPQDIPDTVSQASAAAGAAASLLAAARGTLLAKVEYPREREVSQEEPRLGVFVCHCGLNIAAVVDVAAVSDYARSLPGVVYAQHFTFTCATDSLEKIQELIASEGLNRVVVAACSPRTHESLFQESLRKAGLNKYLFEMANIRDQDSWVHQADPALATEKAKELVRMAVARATVLEPLTELPFEVTPSALVVGNGLAALTAALTIANAGYLVHLAAREERYGLGGLAHKVHYTLEGHALQPYIQECIRQVDEHPRIRWWPNTRVASFSGHMGKFRSWLESPEERRELEYGVAVIATGGVEHKPTEYLYGQHPRVFTLMDFDNLLVTNPDILGEAPRVAMIQCVGSREPEHPYCSRVCCSKAVKNAIRIKEIHPRARVFILYRDLRTYGLKEIYYKKARELGVQFIRYDSDRKPEVTPGGEGLRITVFDQNLKANLALEVDFLALAAAIRPHPQSQDIARVFKLPFDADGFFMEAHLKLRPLDFAASGIFLCGLAHSPKFLEESIVQAQGAAARALSILSQKEMYVGAAVARVDSQHCILCLACMRTCPFGVPRVNQGEGVIAIDPAACKGCGNCASACPRKAIDVMHHRDRQFICKICGIGVADLEQAAS